MTLSLADIQRWDPEQIDEVADAAADRARTSHQQAQELRNLPVFAAWDGDAASAAKASITATHTRLELSAREAFLVSLGAKRAYQEAQAVVKEVRDLLAYAAEPPAVEVNVFTSTAVSPDVSGRTAADVVNVSAKVAELNGRIVSALTHAEDTDADLARVLTAATGDDHVWAGEQRVPEPPRDDPQRKQASAEAFKQVFGRPPLSPTDWTTAEALNPNSYDPRYQGTRPEIRVARIRPVPGQGVVRMSQYIEQRDVWTWPPGKRDFGNDRLATSRFDPESTKVTSYIDYENGLVLIRQNPSVELTDSGAPGAVKVGVPEAHVSQTGDGAVRIKYEAGNPFAPDLFRHPPSPFEDNAMTVNGDLVFTPQAEGVRVDGTRTDYPTMEVYQDMPNGLTHQVAVDSAQSGASHGPGANLPFHHDVGIGGEAFKPFDRGGWSRQYDVPVPLPTSDVGPTTNPPSVPSTTAPSRSALL